VVEELIAAERLRHGLLFERCRVRRLDEAALLADPAVAALDPELDSVLNLNEPADYEAARARPAPEVAVSSGGDPLIIRAATLRAAAEAVGLELDERIAATLNGDEIVLDPGEPLATGDAVAFREA
jgi:molybdopterin-guanine dinucleotide biosynthesis protein A